MLIPQPPILEQLVSVEALQQAFGIIRISRCLGQFSLQFKVQVEVKQLGNLGDKILKE